MVRAFWVLNRQLMMDWAALMFPYQGLDFPPESLLVGDPLPQAGAGPHAELDFRHPFDKLRTGFNQLPCLGV